MLDLRSELDKLTDADIKLLAVGCTAIALAPDDTEHILTETRDALEVSPLDKVTVQRKYKASIVYAMDWMESEDRNGAIFPEDIRKYAEGTIGIVTRPAVIDGLIFAANIRITEIHDKYKDALNYALKWLEKFDNGRDFHGDGKTRAGTD